MSKKIGWIGTGVMGGAMAGHLMTAGYELRVYTRSREKAVDLLERGACWCTSPAEAADGADFAGVMVGFPEDVEEVFLGEHGVLSTVKAGAVIADFTTSSPALAQRIAAVAEERGVGSLDAPVSGGDVGAQNASLSIMIGGDPAVFEQARPVFEAIGKTLVLQGPAGSGQHTKMVNQVVVASTMIGICEALIYARRSGLDPVRVLDSIGGGAATSWGLVNLYPRMLKEDYLPGFYVEHFVKDMGIALEECMRMNIELPGLKLASELYGKLVEMGHGRDGTQALILALDALNA